MQRLEDGTAKFKYVLKSEANAFRIESERWKNRCDWNQTGVKASSEATDGDVEGDASTTATSMGRAMATSMGSRLTRSMISSAAAQASIEKAPILPSPRALREAITAAEGGGIGNAERVGVISELGDRGGEGRCLSMLPCRCCCLAIRFRVLEEAAACCSFVVLSRDSIEVVELLDILLSVLEEIRDTISGRAI